LPYCAVCTLVVSKSQLLGLDEEDDDEIDLPELPLHPEEFTFDDLDIGEIDGDEFQAEHIRILHDAYETHTIFKEALGHTPIKVDPLKLEVDHEKWLGESRNRAPPRQQSPERRKFIEKTVNELLALDCIERCQSPAYSQVHVAPKKTKGDYRFCIDFRGLNDATKRMGFPLPSIKHMLNRLAEGKPKYFAVLDLKSGYWQTEIHPDSRDYTAFITPQGLFRWKRVPMGLKSAGSYFQAQMTQVIGGDLLYNGVDVYLDDIIVYGATEREYLDNLRKLLQRLKDFGVRISPKKASFGKKEIEYVGCVINQHGRTFSDAKKRKVVDFPKPTLMRDMKGFIGLCSYFRDNIPNMSTLLQPLQEMVADYKKGKPLQWTAAREQRFQEVKDTLADCQQLFWMDEDLPIFLHTDASDVGWGAYVFQVGPDGKEYPIQFLSKAFSDVQRRWSVIEREAYGIFAGITQLEHLLRDRQFTLRTDHRNLLYLNAQASPKVTRWKLRLMEFDFLIEHIPGPLNVVADAMSRLCSEAGEPLVTSQTIALAMAVFSAPAPRPPTICINARSAEKATAPRRSERVSNEVFRTLTKCHSHASGHFSRDRTLACLKEYTQRTGSCCWPTEVDMKRDVDSFIASCPVCQRLSQVKRVVHDEAYTISSSAPMVKVSIDTLGPFPADKDGSIYIIVIVDCFSRYVELYPASDCTAEAAARAIVEHFGTFGAPKIILSDNGSQYANQVIGQLASLTDVDLKKTIAYSHEENGITERANKEILRHIRALFDEHNDVSWSLLLPLVKRIMNATVHSATGFAPAAVITPGLDLNQGLIFPHQPDNEDPVIVSDYIRTLHEKQASIVRYVQANLGALFAKNKRKFNERHSTGSYPDGSFVLLQYPTGTRPPTKLHTPWLGPFQVHSHRGGDYELVNLVTGKTLRRHISQLKAFDASRCSPVSVALRNSKDYLVERIISHTGTPSKRAQMRFRVRWLGYGPKDDTQEPWKGVKNNWVFHNYCREQGFDSLIPDAFKDVTMPTFDL
jgi:hypothetical protein